MDGDAAPLHAAEPRHLPLGKLMDGYLKTADHLVVGDFAYDVAGEELVFQAVVDEVLGLDAAVEQAAHLVKHTCVKAGMQALGYALSAQLAGDGYAEGNVGDVRERAQGCRVVGAVGLNFYCAYCALGRVDVGGVVEWLVGCKYVGQLGQALSLKRVAQLLVCRHVGQAVASQHTL